jgi:hypothetical protein
MASGGSAFFAAGGGAAGTGGFMAGSAAGSISSAVSMPIQNLGNHFYFGDPLLTTKELTQGIAVGAFIGGSINGTSATLNGKSFFSGNLNSSTNSITVHSLKIETLKPAEVKTYMKSAEALPPIRQNNLQRTATFRKVDLPGERTAWVKSRNIISSGRPHGVPKHWDAMLQNADELIQSNNVVYLNKSINTALGQKIPTVGNWRPDVIGVGKNGIINITEVVSPSQTYQEIFRKVSTMSGALQNSGYNVNTTIIQPGY